jgi:hypothetical protein
MKNIHRANSDIYITNNSEIREGDWFIRGDEIHICFKIHETDIEFITSIDSVYCGSNTFWGKEYCKKIILTTDEDLIADGVQSIDDDFLQWFVDNSSCEEVKTDLIAVNDFGSEVLVTSYGFDRFIYKIIIPKEEPKQERLYTEKEVIEIVKKSRETGLTAEYLIEQFKKK